MIRLLLFVLLPSFSFRLPATMSCLVRCAHHKRNPSAIMFRNSPADATRKGLGFFEKRRFLFRSTRPTFFLLSTLFFVFRLFSLSLSSMICDYTACSLLCTFLPVHARESLVEMGEKIAGAENKYALI